MVTAILTLFVTLGAGASQVVAPPTVTMQDLTVRADRLPAGCALASAPSVHLDGNRVQYGLWAGFPSNPWIGTDRQIIASIRELVSGPARSPDGPPPGAREQARFVEHLADGVEEGYGAVYLLSDGDRVIVRAIRFAEAERSAADAPSTNPDLATAGNTMRIVIGRTVAVVTGTGKSFCFDAVGGYLAALGH